VRTNTNAHESELFRSRKQEAGVQDRMQHGSRERERERIIALRVGQTIPFLDDEMRKKNEFFLLTPDSTAVGCDCKHTDMAIN